MEDQNGSGSITGAAALGAFCAVALKDPALQTELRQPGCSEQDFIALVLNAARQRGFAFGPEDVKRLMRERMLAGLVEIAVAETSLPPDG